MLSTSNIVSNKVSVIDEPFEDTDVPNKGYIGKNFLKNSITIDDVPSDIIIGTNFSFRDMAEDLLYLENEFKSNPTLNDFLNDYKNGTINLKDAINQTNLILTNISRNFVNDPNRVCFDPNCFYKRVMLLTTAGQPFVDVSTYKDDVLGVKRGLNLETDIVYIETVEKQEIIGQVNEVYNPRNIEINVINQLGVTRKKRYVAYTTPENLVERTPNDKQNDPTNTNSYVYQPLNVINPQESNRKIPLKIERAQDMSTSQEVLDAVKNGWGWSSKVNASYGYLPGFFIAYNSLLPLNDDYAVIIRLSYQIYQ